MDSQKVVVIMPAYHAGGTLEQDYAEIPLECVSNCFVIDDLSADSTVRVAARLGLRVFLHKEGQGDGGNQKTCYIEALRSGADVIVVFPPDGQYDPQQIPQLIAPILEGRADLVLGSRMADAGQPQHAALSTHRPRMVAWCQNKVFGLQLSDYQTGFRAFRRQVLEVCPFLLNSNDFIFDQQLLAQAVWFRARIGGNPRRRPLLSGGKPKELWRVHCVTRLAFSGCLASSSSTARDGSRSWKFRPLALRFLQIAAPVISLRTSWRRSRANSDRPYVSSRRDKSRTVLVPACGTSVCR